MRLLLLKNLSAAGAAIFAVIICVAAALTACGDPDGPPDADLKVYRHADDGAPASLDPARSATVYSERAVVNVFDTLYRYKYLARPYELTPNLAVDFPEVSDNGLVYTFRIRPGVEFADDPAFAGGTGREVTVGDLVYSIQRHFDPEVRSQGAWLWQGRIRGLNEWREAGADYQRPVEGLVPIDDHTLETHLVEPFPQLVATLAMGFSALVPREAVEHYGREFSVRPVGSGPFRLIRFDSTRAVFERNPKFDRGTLDLAAEGYNAELHGRFGLEHLDGRQYPFIDRLEIHFITETTARWNSFVGGREVHNVRVPNEQISQVLAGRDPLQLEPDIAERFHAIDGLEAGFVYLGFNMADERFGHHPDSERDERNRQLRCAMRDAFDWEARNRTFFFGMGDTFPGVIPPMVPEYDPDADHSSLTRDLQRARARLAEAGWDEHNLPEFTYGLVSSVTNRQMFEQFRAQMQEAGIPGGHFVPETFATFGDFSRAMKSRQLDLFWLGWTLDYPDAENTLQLFYGPHATPGSNNVNYENPEFDELFRKTKTMQPGPERTRLYREMNQMIIDDCAAITGLSRTRIHLWHRNVHMVPDEEILGGFFMRFVDVIDDRK